MSRMTGWGSLMVLLGVGTGVYLSRGPWGVYQEQRAQRDAAVKEMRRAEAQRADLVRQKAQLESPMGRERLARERGYMKPGEVPADIP